MNKKLLTFALALTVASCGGDEDNKPVAGTSFFNDQTKMMDKAAAETLMTNFAAHIPPVIKNDYWPRNGYVPGENLAFTTDGSSDSYSVGDAPRKGFDISSAPIIAEGKIFTLGGNGEVEARSVEDPSTTLWNTNVSNVKAGDEQSDKGYIAKMKALFSSDKRAQDFMGGNISYSLETLFVTTKRGEVFAISAKDGKVLWSRGFDFTIRSVPVSREDKIALITTDNKTIVLSAKDGQNIWQHSSTSEGSRVMSSPAPLVVGEKLIVPYSSGEIFALNFNTGNEIWSATPESSAYGKVSTFLNDISQNLVLDNNTIYAVTSDGTLNAIDMNGNVQWALEGLSIARSPWVSGGVLFTTDKFGSLLAISAKEGKLIYKAAMADAKDIDEENLKFTGVIMAGGKLYAADNNGTLYAYSAKNGDVLDKVKIESNVYVTPVVANGKMYFITRDSKLAIVK